MASGGEAWRICVTRLCLTNISFTLTRAQGVPWRTNFVASVQKRLANRAFQQEVDAGCVEHSCLRSWNTEKAATPRKPREDCACIHALVGSLKLADPGAATEPRGLTEATGQLIYSSPLLSQDAARPWMFG